MIWVPKFSAISCQWSYGITRSIRPEIGALSRSKHERNEVCFCPFNGMKKAQRHANKNSALRFCLMRATDNCKLITDNFNRDSSQSRPNGTQPAGIAVAEPLLLH